MTAAEKCACCSRVPTRGTVCDVCRERRAKNKKDERTRRALAGRCSDCSSPAVKDRVRCRKCLNRANRAERNQRIQKYTERLPAAWLGTRAHFYQAVNTNDERVLDEVVRFALLWVAATKRARDKTERLQKKNAA